MTSKKKIVRQRKKARRAMRALRSFIPVSESYRIICGTIGCSTMPVQWSAEDCDAIVEECQLRVVLNGIKGEDTDE